ncbi:RNA 2',3'-cyclic phosphodiesterase [Aquibaculum sediminis]|uniref:RNA 2',3'-cyclic phosphodiesterase n=1 Tax=Aquibaculum sediminis TaxID=3231907 RepID=UPI0034556C76
MRLFIALGLPEDVRERLQFLAGGLPGARWVPPENLHLTLRFLGDVDNGLARDIDDALHGMDFPRFELTLSGIGVFTEGKRINTLWVGVENNPKLERLQAKVDQASVRAGVKPDRRKFKPHVTLARGRIEHGPKLERFLMEHSLFRLHPFTVDAFTLFSSHLQSGGPLYVPEVTYPLECDRLPETDDAAASER